jgi:hypothetical protein
MERPDVQRRSTIGGASDVWDGGTGSDSSDDSSEYCSDLAEEDPRDPNVLYESDFEIVGSGSEEDTGFSLRC